jgi:uncharacterized protein (UPF0218 family)
MIIVYRLTPELRRKLKKPLGILIRGSFSGTVKKFRDIGEREKPPRIISVGDTVSKNLVENNIFPQLSIVDNRVMRKSIKPIELGADETAMVKNPPGTITEEAFTAVQEALESSRRVKIVVDGEEDLLTLIAVLHAPEDSFIVYGQPREGVVIVKATREKKAEVAEILEAMESVSKS